MIGRLLPFMAIAVIGATVVIFSFAQEPRRDDNLISSVPENLPCADQPKSLEALTTAFNSGKLPSPSDMTGTWVGISNFISTYASTMNCSGSRRGPKVFEEVMIANGYSIEMHVVGVGIQRPTAKKDSTNSLSFPFDFGGDAKNPTFRCRLTARKTLACLIDVYRQGIEFKRIPVKPDEMVTAF